MDEMIKEWLLGMYRKEIEDAKAEASNEHLWELGYDGEDPNPHTENVERLHEYIDVLNGLIVETNMVLAGV